MLPALIIVLLVSFVLALSVYAIRQAGEHGHDVRDAVLLLLVPLGLGLARFGGSYSLGVGGGGLTRAGDRLNGPPHRGRHA